MLNDGGVGREHLCRTTTALYRRPVRARLAGALLGAALGAIIALLSIIAWATAGVTASSLGSGEKLFGKTILTDTLLAAAAGFVLGYWIFGGLLERMSDNLRLTRLSNEALLQKLYGGSPSDT